MDPLDFIFPKRCVGCGNVGKYFCADCWGKIEFVQKPVCPICQRQAMEGRVHPGCKTKQGLDGLAVGARYKGAVRAAIAKVKYKFARDLEKVLADILCENLWRFDLPREFVLVPIPLHKRRQNWRGFNQSEVLVRNLAKKYKVKFADTLIRVFETKSQVGLKKDERAQNVLGIFRVKSQQGLSLFLGKNVVLVDDVFTSGATAQEACKVLKRAGAGEVWAMTVALG